MIHTRPYMCLKNGASALPSTFYNDVGNMLTAMRLGRDYNGHMQSGKMPDSPDPLAKVKVSISNGMPVPLGSHKILNGSRSPPRVNTPPSPPINSSSIMSSSSLLSSSSSSSTTTSSSAAIISSSTICHHPPSGISRPSSESSSNGGNGVAKSRQVLRIKRFLSTLQQFASDISPDAGDRVKSLIQGVVSSAVSIEEFHQKIQEVTNYPMRPFAITFLKSHLPMLQTEVYQISRLSKQSPQQYLSKYHDHLLLDTTSSTTHQGQPEAFDIFLPDGKENGKKRPLSSRIPKGSVEFEDTNGDCHPPPSKRHQSMTSPTINQRVSPAAPTSSYLPPGIGFRVDDPPHGYRDSSRYDRFDRFERDFYRPYYGNVSRDYAEDRDMEEEWRNINTMLNCIMGMVEKTKRALAILQHRSYAERSEIPNWTRLGRHLEHELDHKKSRQPDLVPHYKVAEERVSEVRRRAEDAVSEVKRQAVAELQKAVTVAETKANELVAAERMKMERMIAEARRQAAEDAIASAAHQEESTENCWNCGRKANETCSGCNVARYCGSFCQHKDWENHHRVCGQTTNTSSSSSSSINVAGTTTSSTSSRVHPPTDKSPSSSIMDVKPIKTDL